MKNNDLTNIRFGKFLVSDIMIIKPTVAYKLSDDMIMSEDGSTPFITTTSSNNGVAGYSKLEANNKGFSITASDTTVVEAMFYQKYNYIGRSHVQSIRLLDESIVMTEGIGNYLITAMIKSAGDNFNYANKFNRAAMYGLEIVLPIDSDGGVNWNYMEEYIDSIKKKFIESKIAYKDNLKENLESLLENKQKYELEDVEFGEFRVGDIFEVSSGDSTSPQVRESGDIKRVTATTKNNGVNGYINYNDKIKISNNCITGNVFGDFFFQSGEFSYSGDSSCLKNELFSELSYLYLLVVLNKEINGFSFSFNLTSGKLKNQTITLPIDNNGEINIQYMEDYIKHIISKIKQKIKREIVKMEVLKNE